MPIGRNFTRGGNYRTPVPQPANKPPVRQIPDKYSALIRLAERMHEAPTDDNEQTPSSMSLAALEMLEAELKNQGILPWAKKSNISLSNVAAHEANFLRWRLHGSSVSRDRVEFRIDLPNYLLIRAEQVAQHFAAINDTTLNSSYKRLHSRDSSEYERELVYLDSFARYLCGTYSDIEAGSKQGLNLLLRILIRSQELGEISNPASLGKIIVVIPISSKEMLTALRDRVMEANPSH